ncbi:cell division protein FtsX [Prolixibacter denitrificans]|nr:permease-like cell division protein FtsX [Prolixibacter denitrificans]
MSKRKPRRLKRRLFSSYFTTTLSISMVLFLFGLMGLLLLNAKRLSDYVKENIGVTLILNDNARDVDVIRLQKKLDATDYIKSTRFVDKATAAKELKKELGEDFVDFLGYNPLLSSIDVKVYASYANPDSLALLEKKFLEYPEVKEVHYQRNLVRQLNRNVNKLSVILAVLSLLMLVIFIALINNAIRLSIYSRRFLINTMQLIGATRGFIRRPFMSKGVLHGIYGAIIASIMLLGLVFSYQKELKAVINFQNMETMGILLGLVFVLGILISGISTFFAVNKFLRLKFDELFY